MPQLIDSTLEQMRPVYLRAFQNPAALVEEIKRKNVNVASGLVNWWYQRTENRLVAAKVKPDLMGLNFLEINSRTLGGVAKEIVYLMRRADAASMKPTRKVRLIAPELL